MGVMCGMAFTTQTKSECNVNDLFVSPAFSRTNVKRKKVKHKNGI